MPQKPLEDEINDLGYSVVGNLISASRLVDMVEEEHDPKDISFEFDKAVTLLDRYTEMYSKLLWETEKNLPQGSSMQTQANKDPLVLGLTLFFHGLSPQYVKGARSRSNLLKWDLKRSTMDVVNDWITDLVTRTSYKSRFFEMFSKGNIFGSYEVGRIVISSAAYIATGNMDFLVAIEDDFYVQENVSKLMDIFARDRWPKRVKYQILAQDYIEIPADHFLAVGQAISNALTYGKRDRPAIGERDILVSVKCGQSHNEYTIEDQGQGIPGDKLPEIFGGYTSKGTGLGLQYVARIAGLRGGNVAVRSTEPGKETFESDLTKSEVSLVGKDEQQGTTFKLYLPKSHPNI